MPSVARKFQNRPDSAAGKSSLPADQNEPNLKMGERPDWALFRTVEGLSQKAGVPPKQLRRLVLKELADNALDAANRQVKLSSADDSDDAYYVEDDGPGLHGTPEEIAELFSIRRPMRSSKLVRLPQRGALGNGLRVVAGAVLGIPGLAHRHHPQSAYHPAAGGGRVHQRRRGRRDRSSDRHQDRDHARLRSAVRPGAIRLGAGGVQDRGRRQDLRRQVPPHWYDPIHFHELLLAHGQQPLRALIAQLDGCSGGKAGEIVASAGLDRTACEDVTRDEAKRLLKIARANARPVKAERLGFIGREAFPDYAHAIERGVAAIGSAEPRAEIPFVVEVWARKRKGEGSELRCRCSSTARPSPAKSPLIAAVRRRRTWSSSGAGLKHRLPGVMTGTAAFAIRASLLTPYCPLITDGKTPDLSPFIEFTSDAIRAAMRKAQRASPTEKRQSQKDLVLENLDAAIAEVSGDGEFRFNERQLFSGYARSSWTSLARR